MPALGAAGSGRRSARQPLDCGELPQGKGHRGTAELPGPHRGAGEKAARPLCGLHRVLVLLHDARAAVRASGKARVPDDLPVLHGALHVDGPRTARDL